MKTMVSIAELNPKSAGEILEEYIQKIPDGQAVVLSDASAETGLPRTTIDSIARPKGLLINAFVTSEAGNKRRTFLANPKTVAAWQKAQQSK